MIFFNFKKLFIIFFIIVCPLIFVNIQRNWTENNVFFRFTSSITNSIRKVYSNYVHSISNTARLYLVLIQVKRNNIFLQKENHRLQAKLLQTKELQIKNQQLSHMLELKQKYSYDLLSVRVIGKDPFPTYQLITVDKGRSSGVQKNMSAIVNTGMVGYVFRVQNNTSQILLLTDRNSVLPVITQRSRAQGLIEGYTQNRLQLKHVNNEDDIQIGDQIVTSHLNPHTPSGIPIGTVSKIKKDDYGLNPYIEISPSVSFSKLEELFIILRP